jgi:hypothetical protein
VKRGAISRGDPDNPALGPKLLQCPLLKAECRPDQLDQMVVVREEDDLGFRGEFGKDLEAGCRAVVVEVDEQVVDDER